jgi:hypothetical protein
MPVRYTREVLEEAARTPIPRCSTSARTLEPRGLSGMGDTAVSDAYEPRRLASTVAENLRYLCPNCHALTDTWCRNRRKDHQAAA